MADQLILERVEANLSRLRLPRIQQVLAETITVAEAAGKSYLAFLDDLFEEEVAQKEQRRVDTALKISGLPFIKGIDEFDFTFQPKLDRKMVMSLFDLTFIRNHANVVFLGPPGVGKIPSGSRLGSQGLPGRPEHLFHHHGGADRQAEKRPGSRTARQSQELLQIFPGHR